MSDLQKMGGEANHAAQQEEENPQLLEKGSILCMADDGVAHIVHVDNKKKTRRSMTTEKKKAPLESEEALDYRDELSKVPTYKGALMAVPLRVMRTPMAKKLRLPIEDHLVNVPLVFSELSITPFQSLIQEKEEPEKSVEEEKPEESIKEEVPVEPVSKKRSFEARPSTFFDKSSSDYDWLPENWTAEERVRVDGRIDKFYYAPTGEMMRSKKTALAFMKEKGIEVDESAIKRQRPRRVKEEEVSVAEQKSDQKGN